MNDLIINQKLKVFLDNNDNVIKNLITDMIQYCGGSLYQDELSKYNIIIYDKVCFLIYSKYNKEYFYTEAIFTNPEFKKQGYATKLLSMTFEDLGIKGKLIVNIERSRKELLNICKRLKFKHNSSYPLEYIKER